MAAPQGDTAWLNDDDVLDGEEEAPPTLRVPQYASVAVGESLSSPPATNDPPRRRSRLLSRALFTFAVAIVFELGWWGGSRLAPQGEQPLAATKWAPMRVMVLKAPRTLAPPEQPQAPVQKPAPKFFGFLVPTSATSTARAAYEPQGL